MTLAVLLVVMLQVLPQPLGHAMLTMVFGTALATGARDLPVPAPAPRLQSAPAEDCNCGVPASPRGPR
jgi:hypothetical protein